MSTRSDTNRAPDGELPTVRELATLLEFLHGRDSYLTAVAVIFGLAKVETRNGDLDRALLAAQADRRKASGGKNR